MTKAAAIRAWYTTHKLPSVVRECQPCAEAIGTTNAYVWYVLTQEPEQGSRRDYWREVHRRKYASDEKFRQRRKDCAREYQRRKRAEAAMSKVRLNAS